MKLLKQKGLIYSEYIMSMVNNYFLDNEDLCMGVETFYNCREQGYVLEIDSEKDYSKAICIWICAQRNSDDPMIVWEETDIPHENANMFTEDSYYNRTFMFESVTEAGNKVIDIIEEYFNK